MPEGNQMLFAVFMAYSAWSGLLVPQISIQLKICVIFAKIKFAKRCTTRLTVSVPRRNTLHSVTRSGWGMDWAGVDGMIDRADAGANSGIFEGKGGPYKVFVDSLFCTLSSGRAFFFVFCFHLVVEN
jgi:hypothetical protein